MKTLLAFIDQLSDWSGKLFSFLALAIMFIIGYETVARYIFNAPTMWGTEAMTILCGIYSVMGGAYTLYINGHVNVDVVYAALPRRVSTLIDVITAPIVFLFFVVLIWTGAIYGWGSLEWRETTGTVANLPVYPVKVSLPVAAVLITLQAVAKLIRDVQFVITGKDSR
jgi:TRAP-type mannitol/chloroaromatic compound transport system permease small subunit